MSIATTMTMQVIPVNVLEEEEKRGSRPVGYVKDVTSRGTLRDGFVELSDAEYSELEKRYSSEPTLAELAVNFTSSVSRWAAGGFPVVAEDEYQHRQTICSACEFWRTDGLFAHCGKCGCSRLKAWMGTSKCPINKW